MSKKLYDFVNYPIDSLFKTIAFRTALQKAICCNGGGGSAIVGTPNYISKFNATGDNIVDSSIIDDGVTLTIGLPTTISNLSGIGSRMVIVNATGALSTQSIPVGTVTSVGVTTTTTGVSITGSPITSSGNIAVNISTASSSQNGLLSSTDWATFNNKWGLTGNSGTVAGTNFIGTTDNADLYFKRNNIVSGILNQSLNVTLFGVGAMNSNIGSFNTAIGTYSLFSNTGIKNTGVGNQVYSSTSSGSENVGVGHYAGYGMTSGSQNTFVGGSAGWAFNSGSKNVAVGYNALLPLSTGNNQLNIGNVIWGANCSASGTAAGGQISIGANTPHASAILDLTSTTLGFGLPSMTTTQQNAISSPRAGLSVYNSTLGYPTYYNGSSWNAFFSGWGLTGNAGTSATTNFIGTTDNVDVVFKRNNTVSGLIGSTNTGFGLFTITTSATGTANVNFGYACGSKLTTGSDNTAIGSEAANENLTGTANVSVGKSAGRNNTSGNYNTLVGSYAGASLTTAVNNIALGYEALRYASSGNTNIAIGFRALYNNQGNENYAIGANSLQNNSTGTGNVAFGPNALQNNTTGNNNVAIGYRSMLTAGTGSSNVAVGLQTLYSNSSGSDNVALGYAALQSNNASYNTALGSGALLNNTSGNYNTAGGHGSLYYNTTGVENTAFGQYSGFNTTTGSQNTFIGKNAGYHNTTGVKNIYIGHNAVAYFLNNTGDKNVIIGVDARQPTPGASNQLNIGNVLWGANCTGTGDTPAGQLSVGAAVPHTSAIFDLTSTSKGLGLPQMTTSQINAISTPKSGLTVYNTELNTICFYNGTSWQKVTSSAM